MGSRETEATPAIADGGTPAHLLDHSAFRVAPNPGVYAVPVENRPTRNAAFEYPNDTGAPDVQEEPVAAHPPARLGNDQDSRGGGAWLNFRHPLDIAGQGRISERVVGPDRPAQMPIAMTVRPFDKTMGRSDGFRGGLHGVVPVVSGQPRGQQHSVNVSRPTFRVPPAPWEESIPRVGG